MDFGLSHEQQMVVDTVRTFVETELYPLEDEIERSGHVALELGREIQQKVLDLGFYAANIPMEYGGGGLDHLT
ncbi:MAG TPA: acyl-CoA dehydrogenase family protein, partial [Rhodospirillales bacterium]|nr:acyl-CoA dehydrogenase family protein [Rhodospirillales bacterium]